VQELIDRIDAVQQAEVQRLASEFYSPGALSVAGVGPAEEPFLGAIEALSAPSGHAAGDDGAGAAALAGPRRGQ